MSEVAALLRQARQVITDPKKFALGTVDNGYGGHCALGAIGIASSGDSYRVNHDKTTVVGRAVWALAESVNESDYQPDFDHQHARLSHVPVNEQEAVQWAIDNDWAQAVVADYSNCAGHECVLRWFDYTADRLEKAEVTA